MLVMRPAAAEDGEPIVAMTEARADWLEAHGLHGHGWRKFAPEYGRQVADPDVPTWVLTRDSRAVGVTCLYDESPPWFWTPEELAEPAFFVASTVTDPAFAGQGLGHLMLRWVLDHAARTGKKWVRRGTIEPDLVRYYSQVQGWQIVREKTRDGVTVVGLARHAELQPDLPVMTGMLIN